MSVLLLGVDIGSTNIKALLTTPDGEVVSAASAEIVELYPAEGRVEQDPAAIWEGVVQVVNRVAEGVNPADIAGIAMDSNRCGLLLADGNGIPLTNLMTWRDSRSLDNVARFKKENPQLDLYRLTGEEGLPQHSLFKALWCQQREPSLWAGCRMVFLSPKDYVLFRMLGRHVTSRSIAQSSGLFDIQTLGYSPEILAAAGIDEGLLPIPLDSHETLGKLEKPMAKLLGLPAGLPVICGLCDATASQVGAGAVSEGVFAVSIGTCGAVRTFSPRPVFTEKSFAQIRVVSPFGYVPSCTVSDAGSVLKWYRNQFCGLESIQAESQGVSVYRLLDEEAAKVPPGCQGLLLLPYFTGSGYAVKDAEACGVFAGMRNYHTHAHFSRAILEGVAFSLRAVMDGFRQDGYAVREVRMGGGGASSPLWMQILADVLGVPIRSPACPEASAMGSAVLAAVGLGIYSDLSTAVSQMVRDGPAFQPQPENVKRYEDRYRVFCQLMDRLRGLEISAMTP